MTPFDANGIPIKRTKNSIIFIFKYLRLLLQPFFCGYFLQMYASHSRAIIDTRQFTHGRGKQPYIELWGLIISVLILDFT